MHLEAGTRPDDDLGFLCDGGHGRSDDVGGERVVVGHAAGAERVVGQRIAGVSGAVIVFVAAAPDLVGGVLNGQQRGIPGPDERSLVAGVPVFRRGRGRVDHEVRRVRRSRLHEDVHPVIE